MSGGDDLGYYKDEPGKRDTYLLPARRKGENCLNCNQDYYHHAGWACSEARSGQDFDDIPWQERYCTVSMRASRGLGPKGAYASLYANVAPAAPTATAMVETKVDLSDWRTWAPRREPGHCGCGIHKSMCDYHR